MFVQLQQTPIGRVDNPNPKLRKALRRETIEISKDDSRSGYITFHYGQDVAGRTLSEIREYYHRFLELHLLFDTLPPDYPVEVALGKKDVICRLCILGKHCDIHVIDKDKDENTASENKYTELFIDILTKHPELQAGKPTRWQAQTTRPDQQVPEIVMETTVGTMKNVFTYYLDTVRQGNRRRRYFGDFK